MDTTNENGERLGSKDSSKTRQEQSKSDSDMDQKRQSHNQVERHRKQRVAEILSKLDTLVPRDSDGDRQSSVEILERACNYMKTLQQQHDELIKERGDPAQVAELFRLREKFMDMKQERDLYAKVVFGHGISLQTNKEHWKNRHSKPSAVNQAPSSEEQCAARTVNGHNNNKKRRKSQRPNTVGMKLQEKKMRQQQLQNILSVLQLPADTTAKPLPHPTTGQPPSSSCMIEMAMKVAGIGPSTDCPNPDQNVPVSASSQQVAHAKDRQLLPSNACPQTTTVTAASAVSSQPATSCASLSVAVVSSTPTPPTVTIGQTQATTPSSSSLQLAGGCSMLRLPLILPPGNLGSQPLQTVPLSHVVAESPATTTTSQTIVGSVSSTSSLVTGGKTILIPISKGQFLSVPVVPSNNTPTTIMLPAGHSLPVTSQPQVVQNQAIGMVTPAQPGVDQLQAVTASSTRGQQQPVTDSESQKQLNPLTNIRSQQGLLHVNNVHGTIPTVTQDVVKQQSSNVASTIKLLRLTKPLKENSIKRSSHVKSTARKKSERTILPRPTSVPSEAMNTLAVVNTTAGTNLVPSVVTSVLSAVSSPFGLVNTTAGMTSVTSVVTSVPCVQTSALSASVLYKPQGKKNFADPVVPSGSVVSQISSAAVHPSLDTQMANTSSTESSVLPSTSVEPLVPATAQSQVASKIYQGKASAKTSTKPPPRLKYLKTTIRKNVKRKSVPAATSAPSVVTSSSAVVSSVPGTNLVTSVVTSVTAAQTSVTSVTAVQTSVTSITAVQTSVLPASTASEPQGNKSFTQDPVVSSGHVVSRVFSAASNPSLDTQTADTTSTKSSVLPSTVVEASVPATTQSWVGLSMPVVLSPTSDTPPAFTHEAQDKRKVSVQHSNGRLTVKRDRFQRRGHIYEGDEDNLPPPKQRKTENTNLTSSSVSVEKGTQGTLNIQQTRKGEQMPLLENQNKQQSTHLSLEIFDMAKSDATLTFDPALSLEERKSDGTSSIDPIFSVQETSEKVSVMTENGEDKNSEGQTESHPLTRVEKTSTETFEIVSELSKSSSLVMTQDSRYKRLSCHIPSSFDTVHDDPTAVNKDSGINSDMVNSTNQGIVHRTKNDRVSCSDQNEINTRVPDRVSGTGQNEINSAAHDRVIGSDHNKNNCTSADSLVSLKNTAPVWSFTVASQPSSRSADTRSLSEQFQRQSIDFATNVKLSTSVLPALGLQTLSSSEDGTCHLQEKQQQSSLAPAVKDLAMKHTGIMKPIQQLFPGLGQLSETSSHSAATLTAMPQTSPDFHSSSLAMFTTLSQLVSQAPPPLYNPVTVTSAAQSQLPSMSTAAIISSLSPVTSPQSTAYSSQILHNTYANTISFIPVSSHHHHHQHMFSPISSTTTKTCSLPSSTVHRQALTTTSASNSHVSRPSPVGLTSLFQVSSNISPHIFTSMPAPSVGLPVFPSLTQSQMSVTSSVLTAVNPPQCLDQAQHQAPHIPSQSLAVNIPAVSDTKTHTHYHSQPSLSALAGPSVKTSDILCPNATLFDNARTKIKNFDKGMPEKNVDKSRNRQQTSIYSAENFVQPSHQNTSLSSLQNPNTEPDRLYQRHFSSRGEAGMGRNVGMNDSSGFNFTSIGLNLTSEPSDSAGQETGIMSSTNGSFSFNLSLPMPVQPPGTLTSAPLDNPAPPFLLFSSQASTQMPVTDHTNQSLSMLMPNMGLSRNGHTSRKPSDKAMSLPSPNVNFGSIMGGSVNCYERFDKDLSKLGNGMDRMLVGGSLRHGQSASGIGDNGIGNGQKPALDMLPHQFSQPQHLTLPLDHMSPVCRSPQAEQSSRSSSNYFPSSTFHSSTLDTHPLHHHPLPTSDAGPISHRFEPSLGASQMTSASRFDAYGTVYPKDFHHLTKPLEHMMSSDTQRGGCQQQLQQPGEVRTGQNSTGESSGSSLGGGLAHNHSYSSSFSHNRSTPSGQRPPSSSPTIQNCPSKRKQQQSSSNKRKAAYSSSSVTDFVHNITQTNRTMEGEGDKFSANSLFTTTSSSLSSSSRNTSELGPSYPMFPPSRPPNGIGINYQPSFGTNTDPSSGPYVNTFSLSPMKIPNPASSILPPPQASMTPNSIQHPHQGRSLYHDHSHHGQPPLLPNMSFLSHNPSFDARAMSQGLGSGVGPAPFPAAGRPSTLTSFTLHSMQDH